MSYKHFVFLSISLRSIICSRLLLLGLEVQSVQFSRSVMSKSLWPHELQHVRLPCPSPTPGVYSSQWCHPAILSFLVPLLLPSVFPSISVFPNESILHIRWPNYRSFSMSLPMNMQNWFPLGLTSWISL